MAAWEGLEAGHGLAGDAVENPPEPWYWPAGIVLLYAVRIPAWVIAALAVFFADRPEPNTRYEPLLLVLTLMLVGLGIIYTPVLRRYVRPLFGRTFARNADLLVLAGVDMAAVMAVLYFSGGYNSPYYHFAVVAIIVPSFLLGWVASLLVLVAFLVGMVTTWATAGAGLDGPWTENVLGWGIPGMILTPVITVLVSRYLAWLAVRLEDRRRETRRALVDTEVLFEAANASALGTSEQELIAGAVTSLAATGRFSHVSGWQRTTDGYRCLAGVDPRVPAGTPPSPAAIASALSRGGDAKSVSPGPENSLRALPLHARGDEWGALAVAEPPAQPSAGNERLLRSVCSELSLGLTQIAVHREQEALAALEERSRIAGEIHDGIAQSIYMLSLSLEKAADAVADDPNLGPRLSGLVGLAKETLIEVRHYIFDLKPLLEGDVTLVSTLRGQVREFQTVTEIPVAFEIEGEEPRLDMPQRTSLYRILQEALANAFRHARPRAITVRLAFQLAEASLEVEDDGLGFEPSVTTNGHGLRSISDRATAIGGRVDVESHQGRGTRLRVTFPLSGGTP